MTRTPEGCCVIAVCVCYIDGTHGSSLIPTTYLVFPFGPFGARYMEYAIWLAFSGRHEMVGDVGLDEVFLGSEMGFYGRVTLEDGLMLPIKGQPPTETMQRQ